MYLCNVNYCRVLIRCTVCVLLLLLSSCSASRFVPEGEHLLDGVMVRADSSSVNVGSLEGFVRQHPNSKWFGCLKVPLGIYCMSGKNERLWVNKIVRRMGEAPVIYNPTQAENTLLNLRNAVKTMGYLDAEAELLQENKRHKTRIHYQIHPGQRHYIRHISYDIQDTCVARILEEGSYAFRLQEGMPFDAGKLNSERNRLNNYLVNHGFYYFNKTCIYFEADTTVADHQVDVRMVLAGYYDAETKEEKEHRQLSIGAVRYNCEQEGKDKPFIRQGVLQTCTEIEPGELYQENDVEKTYERLIRLGAVRSSNITFEEMPEDSTQLIANITISPAKPNALKLDVEGTNSAGDLGAAIAGSYVNRNLFHGSELLTLKLRGAYEAIRGLKGYGDQNFLEISAQASLAFPDFKMPFLSRDFRRSVKATSEFSVMYNSQDRPEFNRRLLNGSWRYLWQHFGGRMQNKADIIELNYVFMPWISNTFYQTYLADPSNRNAILRYNYENLFIMKWGYGFTYHSPGKNSQGNNYGTNGYVIRASVETAGNFLYALSQSPAFSKNSEGQYTLLNIAYAQYAKFDFDFSKSFRINEDNSLALHMGLGIAYPYANSTILPFEKRYFSGGANSVRGWSVRQLGPGSFKGTDGRIDFINQTGDIKLDLNAEYRAHLFWKLDGALFVDAGNIWTIRDYPEQPGGQFRFDEFYNQIAVAYGLGLRLNVSYFLLRFDFGMKAINPAYSTTREHYPIYHPNMKRDFTFHFAVGLPF